MLLPALSLILGLVLLVWSADRFVEGSAATARHFGMPPLLIGMIIVGFGTSAPEMIVSAMSSFQGNPGIALGNAYGSNITNIALILGLTALLRPITVHSRVLRNELPILAAVTALAAFQAWNGTLSRMEGVFLMAAFLALMLWTIRQQMQKDSLEQEVAKELKAHALPLKSAITWLSAGLIMLIASSRLLVWGAVEIAQAAGVSDLIIGLTIVAIGTSLPELASSIVAARKGEHDIALGNILGSNLFNTLAVVGIAGLIHPMAIPPEVLGRDIATMAILTVSLFAICWGFGGKPGRISRLEGALLLSSYIGYASWLAFRAV